MSSHVQKKDIKKTETLMNHQLLSKFINLEAFHNS